MSVAAARCSDANTLRSDEVFADELRRAAADGELLLQQQVLASTIRRCSSARATSSSR